jgi:hypothetical protein
MGVMVSLPPTDLLIQGDIITDMNILPPNILPPNILPRETRHLGYYITQRYNQCIYEWNAFSKLYSIAISIVYPNMPFIVTFFQRICLDI